MRVWDVTTGIHLVRLKHRLLLDNSAFGRRPFSMVVFSSDGTHLAAVDKYGTVRVWEVTTGRELAYLAHDSWEIALSSDGTRLASSRYRGDIYVWDVTTGRKLARLAIETETRHVYISDDGSRVVTWNEDSLPRVREVATGKELARLPHEGENVVNAVFSLDGQHLATTTKDNLGDGTVNWMVRVWEVATGRELARLPNTGLGITLSSDGTRLATGMDSGNMLSVWDVVTGRELARVGPQPFKGGSVSR